MLTWDSIKELLTPTNSSSWLVLSSTQFSQELHSKQARKRFCGHLEILTITEDLEALCLMMKTAIASMKLCGHPVSHMHTRTVNHSLSIIVNLQDIQLSSLFLLYRSPPMCLLKSHTAIGRFYLNGDSK